MIAAIVAVFVDVLVRQELAHGAHVLLDLVFEPLASVLQAVLAHNQRLWTWRTGTMGGGIQK